MSYLKILSPDEEEFVWIKRPAVGGRSYMIINFAEKRTAFADMLDTLSYISVEEVSAIDDQLASIVFRFDEQRPENYVSMMADIPAIMDSLPL